MVSGMQVHLSDWGVCVNRTCIRHAGTFERLGHMCQSHLHLVADMRASMEGLQWCTALATACGATQCTMWDCGTGEGGGSGGDAWWAAAADEDELVDAPRRVERLDVTYARASKQARRALLPPADPCITPWKSGGRL